MNKPRRLEHLLPWLGILAAASGWALSHQLGSNTVFDDCRAGLGLVLLACLAGLLIVAAGAYVSFDIWRRSDETAGRRFIGIVGTLLAGLAAFAIVLQAVSALILPRCVG
jgi:hypothetical protein